MRVIAHYLECPDPCLPVTSMADGWRAEQRAQRDRVPADAWIHHERYQLPAASDSGKAGMRICRRDVPNSMRCCDGFEVRV